MSLATICAGVAPSGLPMLMSMMSSPRRRAASLQFGGDVENVGGKSIDARKTALARREWTFESPNVSARNRPSDVGLERAGDDRNRSWRASVSQRVNGS